nr:heavy metal-responsive transcriptional regulator [Oscillatoria sp. FACHB-1406]
MLKIGRVAQESGLPVKTVRYYEELGLLAPVVERSEAGYRLFDPQIFQRLAFIKRAQSLGLSLNEIREVLEIRDRGELPCGKIRQRLEGELRSIRAKILALETLQFEIEEILSGWQEYPSPERIEETICPNLDEL